MSNLPPDQWAKRERLVHWWVGENWVDSLYDPFTQVLCVVHTRTQKFWNPDMDSVVRDDKKNVTCQECLELLHA